MTDPLRFAIAALPLAAYLILLGLVNLRRRPLVATGAGDLGALGLALSGCAFVGPAALFRPEAATSEVGNYVWLLLMCLYWLGVVLAIMLCRPRLVVYNLSAEELRPVLSDAIRELDSTARWAGDSLVLPALGVQAHLDGVLWSRNTSLIASGGAQQLEGWGRLNRAVQRSLRKATSRPGPAGLALLAGGIFLLIATIYGLLSNPLEVVVSWQQISAFSGG